MAMCQSYCTHGGRCPLNEGHAPPHDSGSCTWTDDETLTREQADAVLRTKPGGAEFLDDGMQDMADWLEMQGMYGED